MKLRWYPYPFHIEKIVYFVNILKKINDNVCPVDITLADDSTHRRVWGEIFPRWREFDRKGLRRLGKRGYRLIPYLLLLYIGDRIEYYWGFSEELLVKILEEGRDYLIEMAKLRLEVPTKVKIDHETLLKMIESCPLMLKNAIGKDGVLRTKYPVGNREIDLVFFAEDGDIWVFEIEPEVNRGTWGEVRSYKYWLASEENIQVSRIEEGIICLRCPRDILLSCKREGIKVFIPALTEL
jgi:hypothetical protein